MAAKWPPLVIVVPGIATEAGWIGQQRDQFMKFPDRARPPVQEQEREGGWADAWLMDEVQLDLVGPISDR